MATRYRRIPAEAIRVPLPDTMQKRDYSCGAAALMAIAAYYGRGPEYEEDFINVLRGLGMDPRVGSHPDQIARAAQHLGLRTHMLKRGRSADVLAALRRGRPVLLMLQAWGNTRKDGRSPGYRDVWTEGHWVVAIGYDRTSIYFEDPSLEAIRGYLTREELEDRWHDTGRRGRHLEHVCMVIWRPGRNLNGYLRRARHID